MNAPKLTVRMTTVRLGGLLILHGPQEVVTMHLIEQAVKFWRAQFPKSEIDTIEIEITMINLTEAYK